MAERSRSQRSSRGAFDSAQAPLLRHRRGRGFFGLTGHNGDGILRIEEVFVLLGSRLKTDSRGSVG
jgi:hypothetical protein